MTKKIVDLTELPDFPALRQIGASLWDAGDTRGAAVMVGSGFSRNADLASPKSKKPPLWPDILEALNKELNPGGGVFNGDPLKLAEEYRAQYGETALEGLIRNLVPDSQWDPGAIHKMLMRLPWKDVLTTNWDTLLERATKEPPSRSYEVVLARNDIARTRSPRIVKLHGSLPSHTPFIFTEDDYRKYPVDYSPFVNLVRQVLLENDLCLVGFSGDDPNFLQWSGWVRDELGASARRIFLIGVLHLTPSKRRYLERRHISPIDLAPLLEGYEGDDPYKYATRRVLEYFRDSMPSPSSWPSAVIEEKLKNYTSPPATDTVSITDFHGRRKDSKRMAVVIENVLSTLEELKESYPEWIVCPRETRQNLSWKIRHIELDLKSALPSIDKKIAAKALFKITWLTDVLLQPISDSLLAMMEDAVVGDMSSCTSASEKSFIANVIIKHYRMSCLDDGYHRWEKWFENNLHLNDENSARLAYERAIYARDRIDFVGLIKNLQDVKGDDPIWLLRRASLNAEIGNFNDADRDIRKATNALEARRLRDQNSLWIASRLAWAAYLTRALQFIEKKPSNEEVDASQMYETKDWPSNFRELKCDPWDELSSLGEAIHESIESGREDLRVVATKFDAGHYSYSGPRVSSQPSFPEIRNELIRVLDGVGVPLSLEYANLTKDRVIKAFSLNRAESLGDHLRQIRVYARSDEKIIENFLSRIDVAQIDISVVLEMVKTLREAIAFAEKRFQPIPDDADAGSRRMFWVDQTRYFLEILSRLVIRLPEDQAASIFDEACNHASKSEWVHMWLFENLNRLLNRSLLAISPLKRSGLALQAINLPLMCEKGFGDTPYTLDVSESMGIVAIKRDSGSSAWSKRINELIEIVQSRSDKSRAEASIRLAYLYINDALLAEEKAALAQALWALSDGKKTLPQKTNLYPHIFLCLPEPSVGLTEDIFSGIYYSKNNESTNISADFLRAVHGATTSRSRGSFFPSVDQAQHLLKIILEWKPPASNRLNPFWIKPGYEVKTYIGQVVADACLQQLDSTSWSPEQSKNLVDWIDSSDFASTLICIPELVRLDVNLLNWAQSKLQRALMSRDRDTIHFGIYAVARWLEMREDEKISPLPQGIVKLAVSNVTNRRHFQLHHAIHLCDLLAIHEALTADDLKLLADAMDDLWIETQYEVWDVQSPETFALSFIRANCVLLSRTLISLGLTSDALTKWVEEAALDPLPEVRLALDGIYPERSEDKKERKRVRRRVARST